MRWLTLKDDPIAGGTKYDDIKASAAALLTPVAGDAIVPTTSQADPGTRTLDRNSDVRGTRANTAPVGFASEPSMTFGSRAWTSLTRRMLRKAMGGTITSSGAAPAAVLSTLQMLQGQMSALPALQGVLVREAQVDRMTGLWINELVMNFPADEEGTLEATMMGLYHQVDPTANVVTLPNIVSPAGQNVAYMLRDITAYQGAGAGVIIDCLGGFGCTINNNLSDDFRTRFCSGQNIQDVTIDGVLHSIWFPKRNRLRAQTITGRLDFGDSRPDREARRIAAHAERLVVNLFADPLATTPVVDESIQLIFHKQMPTGGGAEPLSREGDQQSSYEFTAYVDDTTGKDLEAILAGTVALT